MLGFSVSARQSGSHFDSLRRIRSVSTAVPVSQTQWPLRRKQVPARHPQIRQGKQRQHLRGILGEGAIAHLERAELPPDHPTDDRPGRADWPYSVPSARHRVAPTGSSAHAPATASLQSRMLLSHPAAPGAGPRRCSRCRRCREPRPRRCNLSGAAGRPAGTSSANLSRLHRHRGEAARHCAAGHDQQADEGLSRPVGAADS